MDDRKKIIATILLVFGIVDLWLIWRIAVFCKLNSAWSSCMVYYGVLFIIGIAGEIISWKDSGTYTRTIIASLLIAFDMWVEVLIVCSVYFGWAGMFLGFFVIPGVMILVVHMKESIDDHKANSDTHHMLLTIVNMDKIYKTDKINSLMKKQILGAYHMSYDWEIQWDYSQKKKMMDNSITKMLMDDLNQNNTPMELYIFETKNGWFYMSELKANFLPWDGMYNAIHAQGQVRFTVYVKIQTEAELSLLNDQSEIKYRYYSKYGKKAFKPCEIDAGFLA